MKTRYRDGLAGAADVVAFDPVKIGETNSFERPKSYGAGVRHVLVNGVPVIAGGEHTGAMPGVAILGPGAKARVLSPRKERGALPAVPGRGRVSVTESERLSSKWMTRSERAQRGTIWQHA